jgi:hypothetical protein
MDPLGDALSEAGGIAAPRERAAQLRGLLAAELDRSAKELAEARSGYPDPVTVVFALAPGAGRALVAALPVAPALRADPDAANERSWLLTAAAVGALVDSGAGGLRAAGAGAPVGAATPEAGALGAALVLRMAAPPGAPPPDPELAALAFEDHVAPVDRLRARALAVPPHVLADVTDLRSPLDPRHPIAIAAHVAALGGRPADPRSADEHEEAVLARLQGAEAGGAARPHDDPDPARRIARRILQRLDGMGKWGGYHTEFSHLARGFAPADRALAAQIGEQLLKAGLLAEKPSVGQRHVFLNPRRAADIHAAIERGELPAALVRAHK